MKPDFLYNSIHFPHVFLGFLSETQILRYVFEGEGHQVLQNTCMYEVGVKRTEPRHPPPALKRNC